VGARALHEQRERLRDQVIHHLCGTLGATGDVPSDTTSSNLASLATRVTKRDHNGIPLVPITHLGLRLLEDLLRGEVLLHVRIFLYATIDSVVHT
jgi:hypothetical protein